MFLEWLETDRENKSFIYGILLRLLPAIKRVNAGTGIFFWHPSFVICISHRGESVKNNLHRMYLAANSLFSLQYRRYANIQMQNFYRKPLQLPLCIGLPHQVNIFWDCNLKI